MAVEELTKKEQIINYAQNDPFLKISDIAEYVQTTPRYVRTILSEANISLMKLREKYARSMERRLQTPEEVEMQLAVRLKPSSGDMEAGDFGVDVIFEEEYEELQKINKDERLWRIKQVYYNNGKAFCVKELIAFFQDDLTREALASLDSVYGLFSRKGINYSDLTKNIVKFEEPSDDILDILGLPKKENAMVVYRYILLNKIPIGVEKYYLRSEKVELSFSGQLIM